MSEENDNVVTVDFSRGRKRQDTQPEIPVPKPTKRKHTLYDATKLATFHLLIADSMVLVRFKTQDPGVVVPEFVRKDEVSALGFSKKFGLKDFVFDDDGVRAGLLFNGVNMHCDIPWPAVISMACAKTGEEVWWPSTMNKKGTK